MQGSSSQQLGPRSGPKCLEQVLAVRSVLSRQQFRAWYLHDVHGLTQADSAQRMGIDGTYVAQLVRLARANLHKHRIELTESVKIDAKVESDIRSGIRCNECYMLRPCREDGATGPCDMKETALDSTDRYVAFWEWVKNGEYGNIERSEEKQRARHRHG